VNRIAQRRRVILGSDAPGRHNGTKGLGSGSNVTTTEGARDLLEHYELGPSGVFIVGPIDMGTTLLNKQVRALNLVWAQIEAEEVNLDEETSPNTSALARPRALPHDR
jgi:hypothetical protein